MDTTTDHFLRVAVVLKKAGVTETGLSNLMARGQFPRPVRIGTRALRWSEREVDQWMADRLAERDAAGEAAMPDELEAAARDDEPTAPRHLEVPDASVPVGAPVTARRGGRPRKSTNTVLDEPQAAPRPAIAPVTTTRRRGRPRKSPAAVAA